MTDYYHFSSAPDPLTIEADLAFVGLHQAAQTRYITKFIAPSTARSA